MTQVIPHITCRNAAEAIEFYVRAFGATKMGAMVWRSMAVFLFGFEGGSGQALRVWMIRPMSPRQCHLVHG